MDMVLKENKNAASYLVNLFLNVAVTYLIMAACLLVFAVIITYTDFPYELVPGVVLVLTVLSVMLSGVMTARKSGSKGWLAGALSGVVYMVTLYILSSLAFRNTDIGLNTVAMLCIGLFSGTFGGILGINMRKRRR